MAIVTRRYSFTGPDNTDLAEFGEPTAVQNATFPYTVVDIDIDNAVGGAITSLDEYMASRGWAFDPTAVAGEVGKVKVTSNDTTPDFLLAKLVAGPAINLTELNDGGDEDIRIEVSGLTTGEADMAAPGSITVGDSVNAGVATTFVRSDHQHGLPAPAAPPAVDAASASPGVSGKVAREDHKHTATVSTPVATAKANAPGVATSLIRSDHVHRTEVDVFDEGASVGLRPTINFTGTGVTAVDDGPNDRVNVAIPGDDKKVKVTSNDATAGFLKDKIVPGSVGITVTELNDGGDEDLEIGVSIGTPVKTGTANAAGTGTDLVRDDHVHQTALEIEDESINQGDVHTVDFVGAGVSTVVAANKATVTIAGGVGADEKVKVSAADTTPGFLDAKVAAGSGIALNILNPAADEDLEIEVSGADSSNIDTAAPAALGVGDATAIGVSTDLPLADHQHGVPVGTPAKTGTANANGSSGLFNHSDHVHQTALEIEDEGAAQGDAHTVDFVGAGVTAAVAGNQATVTIPGTALAGAAPTSIEPDDAGAVGVSTDAARADHQHAIVAEAPGAIEIGDAAVEGAATSFARSDHQHSLAAPAAPVNVDAAAASAGAATAPARADHKHDVNTAAPVKTGTANAAGSADTLVHSDHVHQTALEIEDEGINQGDVHTIDFVGANISAAVVGNKATVTVVSDDDDKVKVSADDTTPGFLEDKIVAGSVGIAITTLNPGADEDLEIGVNVAAPDDLAAGDASAEGASTSLARADHQHGVPVGAPVSTGGTNASGAATSFSRSDHQHVGTLEVEDESVSVAREPIINFLGAGVSAVAGAGKVDVTIPGGGGLATKAGCEPAGNFAGSPKKATITFATPFADANYAVNITAVTTSNASFDPAVGSKLAGSFVIMLGSSSTNNLTEVCWTATKNGETT